MSYIKRLLVRLFHQLFGVPRISIGFKHSLEGLLYEARIQTKFVTSSSYSVYVPKSKDKAEIPIPHKVSYVLTTDKLPVDYITSIILYDKELKYLDEVKSGFRYYSNTNNELKSKSLEELLIRIIRSSPHNELYIFIFGGMVNVLPSNKANVHVLFNAWVGSSSITVHGTLVEMIRTMYDKISLSLIE